MKRLTLLILIGGLYLFSCSHVSKNASIEKWKSEIMEAEMNFAKMAKEESIYKAFSTFAAEEAIINRNNTLISGKTAIIEHYNKPEFINGDVSLSWKPDFIDVSLSGDLAYTYGRYVYTYRDSTGNTIESEGIFHTIWKKQPDGNWRYVWD